MIDTDKYMEMLDDNLLDSEDVQILVNTLYAEVEQLRMLLLQGVMCMHMTATQTKDWRIYNAEKFERQVREMIE